LKLVHRQISLLKNIFNYYYYYYLLLFIIIVIVIVPFLTEFELFLMK